LLGQALGASFAWEREQVLQVFRIVDVNRDAWQVEHDARFARSLRVGVMRFEAVVAEPQRE
jgi:hypothetical protein